MKHVMATSLLTLALFVVACAQYYPPAVPLSIPLTWTGQQTFSGASPTVLTDGTKSFSSNIGTGILPGSVRDLYWTTTGASGGYAWYVRNGSSVQIFGMGIDRNANADLATTIQLSAPAGIPAIVSQPTCDSTAAGKIWYSGHTSGVKDSAALSAADAADAYAWRALY